MDLLALVDRVGANPGSPADLNGDGIVSAADLLQLLTDWGRSDYVLEVLARDDA